MFVRSTRNRVLLDVAGFHQKETFCPRVFGFSSAGCPGPKVLGFISVIRKMLSGSRTTVEDLVR